MIESEKLTWMSRRLFLLSLRWPSTTKDAVNIKGSGITKLVQQIMETTSGIHNGLLLYFDCGFTRCDHLYGQR